MDYILSQAVEQAGADILDVNVGLPEIDEQEMMIRAVKAVQSVCDLPLQLDSTVRMFWKRGFGYTTASLSSTR